MIAIDFVYDNVRLSEKGFIICDFDEKNGAEVSTSGTHITFKKVKKRYGEKSTLVGYSYEECVAATFDICKDDEIYDPEDREIDEYEFSELMRWLNREAFLKMMFVTDNNKKCYYNASFQVDKIFIGSRLYGLRLTMETDSPFGYGEEIKETLHFSQPNKPQIISNFSDRVGLLYPKIVITTLGSGDFTLFNSQTHTLLKINNCKKDEIIVIDGDTQTIYTNIKSHKILDDFNWEFFCIGSTVKDRRNFIYADMPCEIEITYAPLLFDFL